MKSKLLVFVCLLIFIVPSVVFGEDVIVSLDRAPFIPLVGIPGIPNPSDLKFGDYINSLYRLAISIAALLAVFKIVIAGAKYMLDDVVTHKQEAKDEIRGALVGLLIILGAVLILNTVNTDITKNMIAINPLDNTSSSSTINSIIAEALLANQAAKNFCALAGPSCVNYDCSGIQNDAQPNESDIDACNRVCTTVLKGKFSGNTAGFYGNTDGSIGVHPEWGWDAATCSFDSTQAASCDINGSNACCTQVNQGEWLNDYKMCKAAAQPFDILQCTSYSEGGTDTIGGATECAGAQKQCLGTDGKSGKVLKTFTTPGAVMCQSIAVKADIDAAKAIIDSSTFVAPGTYTPDQLTLLNTALGTSLTSASDIIGIDIIPWSALVTVGYNNTPDSDSLTALANALKAKCTAGSQVVPRWTWSDDTPSVIQAEFYCIK